MHFKLKACDNILNIICVCIEIEKYVVIRMPQFMRGWIDRQMFLFVFNVERGEKNAGSLWGVGGIVEKQALPVLCSAPGAVPACAECSVCFAGRVPSPALLQAATSGLRGAAPGQGRPDCGSLPPQ